MSANHQPSPNPNPITVPHPSNNVQVYIRVRPRADNKKVSTSPLHQTSNSKSPHLLFNPPSNTVTTNNKPYYFDRILMEDIPQKMLYNECVSDMVSDFFQGFNATVFAYGQTGSGKTYTMGTEASSDPSLGESMGVIPRVVNEVFNLVEASSSSALADSESESEPETESESESEPSPPPPPSSWTHEIKVGFLEIYNEEVRDLLNPATLSKNIQIRENAQNEITIQGAETLISTSASHVISLLKRGCDARTTAATNVHSQSSRSHAIFTLHLEKSRKQISNDDQILEFVSSKFHLVDLAGSERAKRTGAIGERFKESVRINQGLLGLGKVIRALSTSSTTTESNHVPYRESKLTRFLQDSLGGNSRTTMIACVSPDDIDVAEGSNTIIYAAHARNIKNKPKITYNKIRESVDFSTQRQTEAELRSEIDELKMKLAGSPPQQQQQQQVSERSEASES